MSRASITSVPDPRQPSDTSRPEGAPRVLIIEDDYIAAAALQRILHELGYDAWTATTARHALDGAAEKTPDVVLAEIRIPGPVDGIEAASELRQRYRTAIVFLTALADDPTIERAKRVEPSGYLIKPASTTAVKVAIELALDQRERESSVAALEASLAETAITLLSSLNCLPLAVQLEDARGRVIHINPAFRLMFGLNEAGDDLTEVDSATLLRRVCSQCRDTEALEKMVEAQQSSRQSSVGNTIYLSDGRQVELDFIPLIDKERYRGRLLTYRTVSAV